MVGKRSMTTAVSDTLKASRDLTAAAVDARQAEAIVTTMAGTFDDVAATKANLAEVKGFQYLQVRIRSRR